MTSPRRVKRVIRVMGHGGSQPLLVECFDGVKFVLKYKNNPQGPGILVNEYVATKLAAILGVPCPPSEILDLSKELITVADLRVPGTNEPIIGGLSFGSMYMEGAFDNPHPDLMKTVDNLHEIPGVLVLDTWTLNGNRTGNATNIIAYPVGDDGTKYRFAIIDQGHCFTGPGWTAQSLKQAESQKVLCGNNPILAPGISDRRAFDDSLSRLESIERSGLESIIDEIPDEWGLGVAERNALLEFAHARRMVVREIIDMHFQ